MNRDISIRITLDVILMISVIFGWWFVYIPLAILGVWIFPAYFEILVFAFMHDVLFGMRAGYGILGYVHTIVAVAILIISNYLKRLVKD